MSGRFSTTIPEVLCAERFRLITNDVFRDINEAIKIHQGPRFRAWRKRHFTFVITPSHVSEVPGNIASAATTLKSALTMSSKVDMASDLATVLAYLCEQGFIVNNVRTVSDDSIEYVAYDVTVTGLEPDLATIL